MPINGTDVAPKKISSLKTIIYVMLAAIVGLHMLSLIRTVFDDIADYQHAKHVYFLNSVSDDLYTAVENFGFERGRVNVVLNDVGAVDKMENNRQFILARRLEGDTALSNALSKLSAFNWDDTKDVTAAITRLTPKIENMRRLTARDLVLPKAQREQGLAEVWFAAMTTYIESIELLLIHISNDISDADGMISRYFRLKHETLALRNCAGPEMSILSATILSQAPLSQKLAKKITDLQIITQAHFRNLRHLSQPLKDPRIPEALKALEKSYYEQYVPFRETVFPLALKGGPYPYSQPEFLRPGVQALQQIASFMETIVAVTKDYAEDKLDKSRKQIMLQITISAGSLALIALILYFMHYRIIEPISQVTSTVLRLAKKDLSVKVPLTNAQNEIGEMARAVEVFKTMALQLDKHVAALELASDERDKLISELRETLREIKVLRGILPICSICKNIRNDEGYYEQIESYIHKHSEVDFSHTICPKCFEKHYPEQFTRLKDKDRL